MFVHVLVISNKPPQKGSTRFVVVTEEPGHDETLFAAFKVAYPNSFVEYVSGCDSMDAGGDEDRSPAQYYNYLKDARSLE